MFVKGRKAYPPLFKKTLKSYYMAMPQEKLIRSEIVKAGARLYARGYVAGADGNISARLDKRRILITPSGVSKGFMRPSDLIITDMAGKQLSGKGKPSSEIKMHLLIYSLRPDVAAVVHAHPQAATGYAAAGLLPDKPITAESVLTLGRIALAPYGTPSTDEVTDGLRPFVKGCDTFLLSNHGAATCGKTVEKALFAMETLEHIAQISLVTKILGRSRAISGENLKKLAAIRSLLKKS